ncbi:hypothetical protein NQ317_000753 [Molorchus minor]|uniref:Protein msta n=1 Tax=Molorchus minor TaxID=1323400 RepID=A0ABQ9J6D4_9CUCU|nr:hypothetical protein NQ317_000753 [Molorchus minor]
MLSKCNARFLMKKTRMVVRASVFIKEGTEIFHSYSRIIWGTMTRIYHLLRTKHFICKCERCSDPTEFGTYMTAIYCKECKGKVIPINPLKSESNWKCEECKTIVTGTQVGELMSVLGSILNGCDRVVSDIQRILNFLNSKLLNIVPENNLVVVEIKYKMIWTLGHEKGLTWKEIPIDLLITKKKFCEDILRLLKQLRTGQCKMRGLLLFELFECLEEIKSRGHKQSDVDFEKSEKSLEEAANILKYDVSAPDLIKHKWQILESLWYK